MSNITFDYKPWDGKVDFQLFQPGNALGFSVINSSLDLDFDLRYKDVTVKEAVDGVIELLAGSLEWLREFGMSADEVTQRVKAFERKNRDTVNARALKDEYKAIEFVSTRERL